eukprot:936305-Pelagomonas_calceolata.AAC.2
MQASFVMLHALHGCLAGQPCKLAALQKHLQVPHMDQQHIVQIGMCVWVAVLATLAARTIVCLGFALTAPPEDARAVLVDIRRPQGVQSRTCRRPQRGGKHLKSGSGSDGSEAGTGDEDDESESESESEEELPAPLVREVDPEVGKVHAAEVKALPELVLCLEFLFQFRDILRSYGPAGANAAPSVFIPFEGIPRWV